ncbi:MAG: hypothetical protein AB200_00240 [Parcubacteria bacterium C7867-005]|nr:MAG: hypothetical protein AB200_00240 [Parcubacteria bacterium C7867-005]
MITEFLDKINQFVLNPIITLLFAVAFIVFLFGVFQFVKDAKDGDTKGEGKKKIMYGLFGMFIMFSAYGLIRIVLDTFGIDNPQDYISL